MKQMITLICCVFGVTALQADGVSVEPGLWEMNMTMNIPMMPTPQVRTYTECVEESELDPENFQMDQDSECSMSEPEINDNTIQWSIECAGPMGPTKGNWSFTSQGDSMHGDGKMVADMGGQTMEFTMSWKGKRLGNCESTAN